MNELRINVPSSLDSITLGQYQDWVKFLEVEGEDADSDKLDKKLVEIFCKVPSDIVESIKFTEFSSILSVLRDAFEDKGESLVKVFQMDELSYGFIPNLDKLSLGEYVDIDSTLFDFDNIHKAMAVLYRPVSYTNEKNGIQQYVIDKYNPSEEKSIAMKDMPLDAALSARVFFCNLSKGLTKASLTYLGKLKSKKQTTLQEQAFLKDGDGINQFIKSQEETLLELMQLPRLTYLRH